MSLFFKSDEEKRAEAIEAAHNDGQETGSTEGPFGIKSTIDQNYYNARDPELGEAYKAGLENGRANRSND